MADQDRDDRVSGGSANRTLGAIASVKTQQQALAIELERLVAQARHEDITWDRIGAAIGVTRQVVQGRYGSPPQRLEPLDIPALTGTPHAAVREIHGPTATAQISVTIDEPAGAVELTLHATTGNWTGHAGEQPLHRDAVEKALWGLPGQARSQLEAAGRHAQQIAVRRHAGIAKRKATIAARQSPVGRPPRRA